MPGGRSIKLANVLGIRIGVDPSWFFVLFLVIWLLSDQFRANDPSAGDLAFVLATVSALLFFTSVVLHELGHAVVARRNGIGIAGIDLWLFGGLARMRRDADSPGVEFRIAAAGPLVTLAILVAAIGAALALGGGGAFSRALQYETGADAGIAVLAFLAQVNALLLVFNLLPGLPLDGGRIARALVWKVTGDRLRATKAAAAVGRGFGILIAGFGIYLVSRALTGAGDGAVLSGIWLVFIGFFLFQAARATVAQTQVTTRIEGLTVADVMDDDPVALPSELTAARALDEFFLRYGWPWFPVVGEGGRFEGLLRREELDAEAETRTVADLVDPGTRELYGVYEEEPLEALLGSEGLQRLGALAAVDRDGILRGVVTVERVRRALRAPAPTT